MVEQEATSDFDEMFEEAEEQKKQFNKARERLQAVRSKLRESVDTLHAEGTIPDAERDRIVSMIDDGEYGKAREAIAAAAEGDALAFEDEEKEQFARAFEQSWNDLTATVEEMRTGILELRAKSQMSDEDLVNYLYGKHSGLRKGDIREVMDAFSKIEKMGLGPNEMARVLAAFNHDLNVTPTEEILEVIEEEVQ